MPPSPEKKEPFDYTDQKAHFRSMQPQKGDTEEYQKAWKDSVTERKKAKAKIKADKEGGSEEAPETENETEG